MTFVRTPATPRKPFGSALSSLGPPFPPFGLPANQGSFHFYLGSSTFWEPAQQGALGGFAEDVKATPLRILGRLRCGCPDNFTCGYSNCVGGGKVAVSDGRAVLREGALLR